MSKLIVPAHVADEEEAPSALKVPPGITMSMELLMHGIRLGTVSLMRQTLNDMGDMAVYDLGVAIPHPISGEQRVYVIARVYPQLMKKDLDEPSATVVRPPEGVD